MKRNKKKRRVSLGVDPGADGAVALIGGAKVTARVSPWPGKGKTQELYNLVAGWAKEFDIALCMIEDNPAMPGQGATATKSTGVNLGHWEAVMMILGIPILWVRPMKWQSVLLESRKAMNKKRDTKELSCEAAKILWPHINFYGPRGGKLDGLSDACHIARWGYKYLKGEL